MKKIIGLIYLSLLVPVTLRAQDPMYTHAFMAPVYLNPAATGMADYDFRVSAIYRRQWLIVPSGMQYFSVAADKYSYEHNVGFGLMSNSEQEGYIKKLSFNGTFAKQLCFGSHRLSLGIQGGMFNRQIDYGKLWFADQITNQGIITNLPSQVSPNVNNRKWLPDFAAGALWVHNSGFMIGASVHHLNQPDESFTNKEESKLPRRLTAETRVPILNLTNQLWDDDVLLMGGMVYSLQRKNQTISTNLEIKTHYLNLGLSYRITKNVRNSDAFSVTITLDNFTGRNNPDNPDKIKGGFAFDATTNGAGFTRTAGSTEGAVSWEHLYNSDATSDNRCNSSARNPIPCPPNLYRRIF